MDGCVAVEIDRLGVQWHEGQAIESIATHNIVCCGQMHCVDAVVDARGVGSKALLPGVRGELLRIECAGLTLQRPVQLMHPRYQLFVAPCPGNQFVVGATDLEDYYLAEARARKNGKTIPLEDVERQLG